ncbi:MAG TPA: adenylyl-sulfate kinase [Patescibacteria group bacterium]|nr:adenylyl-sulfate kinase [Patescibacteria group bacterium]
MSKDPTLKIVIVGHVDHGKSTLVGRLLHETGSLPDGKIDNLREVCEKRGMPFEWAFVMDALQAERDQGITIDVSHIPFQSARRPYVIIDAPGHKEFLKNMVTGAASADAAVLVIDAIEGVQEQSRRHGYLLHLLGLRQLAVVVNKMDAVDYSQARFDEVSAEIRAYLGGFGVVPTQIIPIAARHGDNIIAASENTPWYTGPAVLEALDGFDPAALETELPLRFPVQDVYKLDHRRIVAGRIESGKLKIGDRLLFSPSGKTARVATIELWSAPTSTSAIAGQSIGVTLDEQIFIERGQIASHIEDAPLGTDVFRAKLFWLGRAPLTAGRRYKLKLATAEHIVTVEKVERVIDVADLASVANDWVERNAVAEVVFRARSKVALDPFIENPRTGRFVLVDNYDIVGGGVISMEGFPDNRCAPQAVVSSDLTSVAHKVTLADRERVNRHKGGILWLTGLSGAGKSTIGMEVERRLFQKGYQVFVLDGDNVRQGLNADLGFAPEDRAENIRRVGEVANLFAQAGMVVISAFISPYQADRDSARAIAPSLFHEIYIKADVEECQRRDPKGLYAKARQGAIHEFTGVSAPYEAPERPDLVVDTQTLGIEEAVEVVLRYVERDMQREDRQGREMMHPDVAL